MRLFLRVYPLDGRHRQDGSTLSSSGVGPACWGWWSQVAADSAERSSQTTCHSSAAQTTTDISPTAKCRVPPTPKEPAALGICTQVYDNSTKCDPSQFFQIPDTKPDFVWISACLPHLSPGKHLRSNVMLCSMVAISEAELT